MTSILPRRLVDKLLPKVTASSTANHQHYYMRGSPTLSAADVTRLVAAIRGERRSPDLSR